MSKMHVKMTINGTEVEALAEPRTLLIHFLREDQAITGHLVGMGRDLGLEVLATDIERPEQADAVAAMGASWISGVLHGKPELAEEFAPRLV